MEKTKNPKKHFNQLCPMHPEGRESVHFFILGGLVCRRPEGNACGGSPPACCVDKYQELWYNSFKVKNMISAVSVYVKGGAAMPAGRFRSSLCLSAIICRVMFWTPLWVLLLAHYPDSPFLPTVAAAFLIAAGNAAAVRTVGTRAGFRSRRTLLLGLLFTFCATVLCIGTLLLIGCSPFPAFCITCWAVFPVLYKLSADPYLLFTIEHFIMFLSFAVAAQGFLYLSDITNYLQWFLWSTGAIAALFFLQRNQFMLQRMVNRRSNTETAVPQEIRRSNLTIVCILLLFCAVLFIFRAPLTALLERMAALAKAAVIKLISLLMTDEPFENIEEEAENGLPLPEMKSHEWLGYLWALLWIPLIMIVIPVWKFLLSDWVDLLRAFIADIAARLRGKVKPEYKKIDQPAFSDTETKLRRTRTPDRKRTWRKQLRAWQALPDSREKFYAGYQLLITAPAWSDDELRASDTVREIREKWLQHHTPQNALDAVTADYHADCYAEQGLPPQAVRELTEALHTLRAMR